MYDEKEEMNARFKPGDKVFYRDTEKSNKWILRNKHWGNAPIKFGVVVGVYEYLYSVRFEDHLYASLTDHHNVLESDLELDIISTSPLWEAMK